MERARFTGKDVSNLPSNLPNESNIGRVKRNYSYIVPEKKPELSRARSNASQLQRKKTEVEQSTIGQPLTRKHISESALISTTDQQMIPDYLADTLSFMRQQQRKSTQTSPNASAPHTARSRSSSSNITSSQRSTLLEILFDLHFRFKMFPRTLFAIVSLFDRYLAKKRVATQDLSAVGFAVLFLCAKYEETYQVPYLKQIVSMTGNECSVDKVVEMEADVIQTLQFQMITSTAFTFYQPYARLIGLQAKNYHLGHYLLELSMLHEPCLAVPASLLAASTIYLIKKIRKAESSWTQDMSTLVQYSEAQLKSTAKILCALLEIANEVEGGRVTRKKFSSIEYFEVTKIRLERREKKA